MLHIFIQRYCTAFIRREGILQGIGLSFWICLGAACTRLNNFWYHIEFLYRAILMIWFSFHNFFDYFGYCSASLEGWLGNMLRSLTLRIGNMVAHKLVSLINNELIVFVSLCFLQFVARIFNFILKSRLNELYSSFIDIRGDHPLCFMFIFYYDSNKVEKVDEPEIRWRPEFGPKLTRQPPRGLMIFRGLIGKKNNNKK